jgi:hypothetical protein
MPIKFVSASTRPEQSRRGRPSKPKLSEPQKVQFTRFVRRLLSETGETSTALSARIWPEACLGALCRGCSTCDPSLPVANRRRLDDLLNGGRGVTYERVGEIVDWVLSDDAKKILGRVLPSSLNRVHTFRTLADAAKNWVASSIANAPVPMLVLPEDVEIVVDSLAQFLTDKKFNGFEPGSDAKVVLKEYFMRKTKKARGDGSTQTGKLTFLDECRWALGVAVERRAELTLGCDSSGKRIEGLPFPTLKSKAVITEEGLRLTPRRLRSVIATIHTFTALERANTAAGNFKRLPIAERRQKLRGA